MSRITEWLERRNARDDERLASRSTSWLIARAVLGVVFLVKGGLQLANATDAWHYAVGPLLAAGGLFLAFESAKAIVARRGKRTQG